ncbi:transporter substrate-binding domain-containing protein [Thalassotalea sp. Y01]|nr:transporter substrate-binding domain-containing protein [Thalassotalea sp. Y01]
MVMLCALSLLAFKPFAKDSTNNANSKATQQAQQTQKNVLRVLVWSGNENYLPRAGSPPNLDRDYLELFADSHGLNLEYIEKPSFEQLIPALLSNEGDIIAANMTVNKLRQEQVDFTLPITETPEYIVLGKNNKALTAAKDLDGRKIAVQPGTSHAITALGLANVYPNIQIEQIPAKTTRDKLYDALAKGEYDLTIVDGNIIDSTLKYRDDIVKSLQANVARSIAWAVRKDSATLKQQLNTFLQQQLSAQQDSESVTAWQTITKRRTIRIVMRNTISSYYLWKGQLMGFHYELAKDFAKQHKLRYEILVADDNIEMFEMIKTGEADIALGFFTPNQHRAEQGLAFSRPYHYASEQIVAGPNDPPIESVHDLKYRNIAVRKSSSYYQTLMDLQSIIPQITVSEAPEEYDTEQIIEGVASGEFDLTLADNHLVDMELNLDTKITPSIFIGKEKAQSWIFKDGNNQLREKIDSYIKRTYRGLFYNLIHKRYFEADGLIDKHHDAYENLQAGGNLSPYDEIVEKYAAQYGFDPHLLIAQMHQESRFDPNATSFAGAQGLFQIMPRTAKQLNIIDVTDPEKGIHAGIKYMAWVSERMQEQEVRDDQLTWFTLASYNAGPGHVIDAMRLAEQKGWQRDIWFNNVERAILLLSQRKYSAKARYGYVRGQEPVTYVRNIRRKYLMLKDVVTTSQ